jgi:hypothetical protein
MNMGKTIRATSGLGRDIRIDRVDFQKKWSDHMCQLYTLSGEDFYEEILAMKQRVQVIAGIEFDRTFDVQVENSRRSRIAIKGKLEIHPFARGSEDSIPRPVVLYEGVCVAYLEDVLESRTITCNENGMTTLCFGDETINWMKEYRS